MVACIGILVVSIIIAVFEVPTLLKKKMLKECFIFSLLLIFGTSSSVALALGIQLPNPVDFIAKTMKPVSDWLTTLLT